MILNSKAMRLILNSCHQFKALRPGVNGYLHVLVIQPPCAVIVVLNHSADRNIQMQFLQYLKRNIYLPLTTVHQQQVREFRKASKLVIHLSAVQIFLFLHTMKKPSGKHLPHAGIIVGAGYRLNSKLAVIAALCLALLENHHGTYVGKSADIGYIKGFHTAHIL